MKPSFFKYIRDLKMERKNLGDVLWYIEGVQIHRWQIEGVQNEHSQTKATF
jgi:hypothetical protein